jgi:hypothetical protein
VALSAGSRIGPYEIKSLGEVGIGIVFRVHDTQLQRDVALKLLSERFANDAYRLARVPYHEGLTFPRKVDRLALKTIKCLYCR